MRFYSMYGSGTNGRAFGAPACSVRIAQGYYRIVVITGGNGLLIYRRVGSGAGEGFAVCIINAPTAVFGSSSLYSHSYSGAAGIVYIKIAEKCKCSSGKIGITFKTINKCVVDGSVCGRNGSKDKNYCKKQRNNFFVFDLFILSFQRCLIFKSKKNIISKKILCNGL